MKIAIMQPYLFPYLGYFQLISAVDKFVIFDDVNYIKQGWINRNRLLNGCADQMFTVPIAKASSFTLIRDTQIDWSRYDAWRIKFLKTLEYQYSRAPFFADTFTLVSGILQSPGATIGDLARDSIDRCCEHLAIDSDIVPTSSVYGNSSLKSAVRIRDICGRSGADIYVNLPGGRGLYEREDFARDGLELRFLRTRIRDYVQFECDFVPGLSIIDVMMFNAPETVRQFASEFDLD